MAKFVSPLLGYNNNVRHKNRVFHIQTEDSGVNHPHIITHLFMDGGRILKSVKKSYAEHVGTDGMKEVVRQMMKEQHKAMFIALRDGQFDHLVDPNAAPPKDAAAPAPAPADEKKEDAAAAIPEAPPTAPDPVAPAPEAKPEPIAAVAELVQPPVEARIVVAEADPDAAPATTRQAEPPAEEARVEIDLAAVEKQPPADASLFQANDLPPPPKNLFAKERGTGTYRSVDAEPEDTRPAPKPAPAPAPVKSPNPPRVAPAAAAAKPQRSDAGRYAPARPAAIFGSTTKPQAQSIFSDDLVSDKSLDEVILSYLAEDLEPPRRK